MESKKVILFNKLSFLSLILTIFLSFFFFIPYVPITTNVSKGFLISVGIIFSTLFWLISRLLDGKFVIPKDKLILFALSIPIVFLISSFFSPSPQNSLWGSGFEIGTFSSMMILFLVFFLSAIHLQTEKKIWSFFIVLLGGALFLAILQIIFTIFNFNDLLPGFFKGISSGSFLSSWNDFSFLYGLIIIISLLKIEFLKINKAYKYGLYFLIALSLIFLIVINVFIVWLLVCLFSVTIFIYNIFLQYTKNKNEKIEVKRKFSFLPIVVILISLFFLIGGNFINPFISKYVNFTNIEVRPSVGATYNIFVKTIKQDPLLGIGPNTFNISWDQWKPIQVNKTDFWNTDFNNGFGLIPTFLITTGLIGFLVWILFFTSFIYRGFKSLIFIFQKISSNHFILTSFIISLYSWIITIIYNPNIVLLVIAFASTGVFIGSLVSKKILINHEISFLKDPRISFFSITIIVILIITSVSAIYIYTNKFISIVYYSNNLNPENNIESLTKSEEKLNRAILFSKSDKYYRTLSQVYIAEIGVLLNDKTLSQDFIKSRIPILINNAEQKASLAINQNPKKYTNWVNLGDIYKSLVPLGISGSYENALQSYKMAMELAPQNPSIFLSQSQLELSNKNIDGAKNLIYEALKLKGNYLDAIFMLAQIEKDRGNIEEAIKQLEYASLVAPNDPNVFFELGLIKYENGRYSEAINSFETSLILNKYYLDTRYFLALSYEKAGKTKEAIKQLNILKESLPNNDFINNKLDSLLNTKNVEEVNKKVN